MANTTQVLISKSLLPGLKMAVIKTKKSSIREFLDELLMQYGIQPEIKEDPSQMHLPILPVADAWTGPQRHYSQLAPPECMACEDPEGDIHTVSCEECDSKVVLCENCRKYGVCAACASKKEGFKEIAADDDIGTVSLKISVSPAVEENHDDDGKTF